MAYLSLYRKWRPQTFDDVVGQEHVVQTLRNALDMGRCAHAYIFSGPRGTGKTTLARLLAKGLNCVEGPTGTWCNTCDQCRRIAKGQSIDVIEIDGASNRGINEIRDVREKVKFAPAEGRYKVYIIDEVHMLTTEAFNALLKMLEEPPAHVVFIFATTEAYRIPATIVSRCQMFSFYGFTPDQVADQVRGVAKAEGASIDEEAIYLIARHADGGMRDALGFLDQCISFAQDGISEALAAQVLGVVEQEQLEQLAVAVADKNLTACLTYVKSVVDSGRDVRQFARDCVQFFRDLMLLQAAPKGKGLVALGGKDLQRARELARRFDVSELLRIVERLGQSEADMRWAQIVQLPLELAFVQLIQSEEQGGGTSVGGVTPDPKTVRSGGETPELAALARRIAALEARLSGAPASSPDGAAASSKAPTEQSKPAEAGGDPIPPPASDGPISTGPDADFLHRVQTEWPRVLEHLRSEKHVQQEAFLREGRPGAYRAGTLTIYFSLNHRFHQANIAREDNKNIVEQAIKKVFRQDVTLDVVLGEAPAVSAPEAAPLSPGPSGPSEPSESSSSFVDETSSKEMHGDEHKQQQRGSSLKGRPEGSAPSPADTSGDTPAESSSSSATVAPSPDVSATSPPEDPPPWQTASSEGGDTASGVKPRKSTHDGEGIPSAGAGDGGEKEENAVKENNKDKREDEGESESEGEEPLIEAALKLFGGTITRLEREGGS